MLGIKKNILTYHSLSLAINRLKSNSLKITKKQPRANFSLFLHNKGNDMIEKLSTNSKLCNDCNYPMNEFMEVKEYDHLTNKEFYEDVPFCGHCFEQDADKARLQVDPETQRMKILNVFKNNVLGGN